MGGGFYVRVKYKQKIVQKRKNNNLKEYINCVNKY